MQAILGIHLLPAQGLVVLLSEDGVVQLLDGDTLEGRALPLRCAPLVMRRRFVCGLHRHRGSPLHSTMCSSVGCCVQERGGHVHSVAAGAPAPLAVAAKPSKKAIRCGWRLDAWPLLMGWC